jgi:hypothetical protein
MVPLIFIWYLLTTPTDRLACSLWVSDLPDRPALINACGLELADNLTRYSLQLVSIYNGAVLCTLPASQVYTEDCGADPLDGFRLNLVLNDYQESLCVLEVTHPGQPSAEEISYQCDHVLLGEHAGETLVMQFIESQSPPAEPDPICELTPPITGDGLYQSPPSAEELATTREYDMLAYKLTWYGMDADVDFWQNQFDPQIWAASSQANIPAHLLKRLIGVESQFWPLWVPGETGEVGLIQITDDGADIALRYSPTLTAQFCPMAMDPARCSLGYPFLSLNEQQLIRDAYRQGMQCLLCDVGQAVERTRSLIQIYADTLAAFRCYAGEVISQEDPTSEIWDVTLAIYHAGPGCVSSGICVQGREYVEKVKLP